MVGLRDKNRIFDFIDELYVSKGVDYPIEKDVYRFMEQLGYNTTDAQVSDVVREYLND